MLKKGIRIILALAIIVSSCTNEKQTIKLKDKSISKIGEPSYLCVYAEGLDSIKCWALNNIGYYKYLGATKDFFLDSLLCFNSSCDRVITCILSSHKDIKAHSDGIDYFYGEKIDGKWYFFSGANITIPRSMVSGHDVTKPLSYQQLHDIALKEVYSGYLNSLGEINEDWFTSHFENVGRCADCKTKEDFQKSILEGVGALWLSRDTTQPIKRLERSNLP